VIGGGASVAGIGKVQGVFLGTSAGGDFTGKSGVYQSNVSNANTDARTVFVQAICARLAG
jgi:hypothetical protein